MKAWLITWEGTDPRIIDENRIAAILSSRRSHNHIEDLIDLLYLKEMSNAHDMLYYANRSKERRKKNRAIFSNRGRIFYGTNPFLYGRIVSEISVISDAEKGVETVRWVEPPIYKQNPDLGFTLELIEGEKQKELLRPIDSTIGVGLGA